MNEKELKQKINYLYCDLEEQCDDLQRLKIKVDEKRDGIADTKKEIEELEKQLSELGVEVDSELHCF